MNFTREPIIETIICPRDGHKLSVRNSKGSACEEYLVDALEVISFGNSLFFRSLERPKSFLLPASDYEVIEVRETRMIVKSLGANIARKPSEKAPEKEQKETSETPQDEEVVSKEKRKDRKRRRKRQKDDDTKDNQTKNPPQLAPEEASESPQPTQQPVEATKGGDKEDEARVSSSQIRKSFLQPPPVLISETISRYKSYGIIEEGPQEGEKQDRTEAYKQQEKPVEGLSERLPEQPVTDAGASDSSSEA